ncbi:MAG TPA: glycoside hydrolase family 30 beta sandwich domain-containing protein [Dyella sp.]
MTVALIAGLIVISFMALYALPSRQMVAPPKIAVVEKPVVPVVELWLSTADRRLKLEPQPDIAMSARGKADADIVVDVHKTYQSMVGFGAAMTDSSAWLIQNKLNALQRAALLHELYGPPPNLDFNMMRLTIGASDFSLKPYTLDDVPVGDSDPSLEHFNVASNLLDVIPTVRQILAIDPQLAIVATSWSAPAWMKSSENLIGGTLLEQYESVYADYLLKYIDTYRKYGIPIFALTLQNEPAFQPLTYPGMAMGSEQRTRLIANYLGPKLATRKPFTRIMEWDHNWSHPEQASSVLAYPEAARYVDSIAWHCYEGSPYAQGRLHRAFPSKDAYLTECSGGDWASSIHGELLWFSRNLLIASIRQWARGVIYWNLALDENHGPHFGGCANCKGVITIDSKTGEVSRNDEYYALAHFSRFVLPGAFRVNSTDTDKGIANVAFQNTVDSSIVLVVVNSNAEERHLSVVDDQSRFEYMMPPKSVGTFVWSQYPGLSLIRRAAWWVQARMAKSGL